MSKARGRRKTVKPGRYTIFSENKDMGSLLGMEEIKVVSIDPAIDNFGFRLEVRTPTSLRTVFMEKSVHEDCFLSLTRYLDSFDMSEASIVLIESQMTINYDMIRVSQHCITYFCLRYPSVIVVELSSKLKTNVLGAPKGMTKPQRKKWSVEEAERIYTKYGDTEGMRMLRSTVGKKDDVADTTTQSEAFFVMTSYVKTTR